MSGKWANHLFDVYNVNDFGCACCLNHVFCGPCIWTSALSKANVKHAELLGVAYFFGQIFNSQLVSGFSYLAMITGRIALAEKFDIKEPFCVSVFMRCPCLYLCSQIQEVNTVMEGRNLKYGCGTLEEKTSEKVSTGQPPLLTMSRF